MVLVFGVVKVADTWTSIIHEVMLTSQANLEEDATHKVLTM